MFFISKFAVSATATFYNGHVITFDGKYVHLPSIDKSCTYLLSRDFKHGMFTFMVKSGQLYMYIGKMGIMLSKYGKVCVCFTSCKLVSEAVHDSVP